MNRFLRAMAVWVLAAGPVSLDGAPITALIYTPDGAALVSNDGGGIAIRAPDDGAVRQPVDCGLRKVDALAVHPSGRYLAVAGGVPAMAGSVVILNWPDARELRRLTSFSDQATCVAFSGDGGWLAAGSADQTVKVWQFRTNEAEAVLVSTLTGHSGPVHALAFGPGGTNLVTAGADRSLKVWGLPSAQLQRSLGHHTEAVHALTVAPAVSGDAGGNSSGLASAGGDHTVRIWQPVIGRMVRIIRHHGGAVLALAYLPDGTALFTAGAEGIVRRIDAGSDEVLAQWPAHSDWIYALAMHPDGSRLASGDWTGEVRVWATDKSGQRATRPPR